MPVTLAPFVGFAIGVLLAWLSRTDPDSDLTWQDPSSRAVVLYALLVFAPVVAYFAAFARDWSFAYVIDGHDVPSAVLLALVLLASGAVVAGFFAGRKALERRAPNELAWLAASPLAITIITVAALFDRFGVDASYEQFTSDFGCKPLFTSPLGFAIVWMDAVLVAGAVFTLRALVPVKRPRQTLEATVTVAPTAHVAPIDGPKRFLGRGRAQR